MRNERLLMVFQENTHKDQVMPTILPNMMNAKMVSKKMSILDQEETYKDLFVAFAAKSSFDNFKEEMFKVIKVIQDIASE